MDTHFRNFARPHLTVCWLKLLVGALVASGDRLTPTEPAGEKYPKPSDFSFTTYNTIQDDFAEVLKEIFQKLFFLSTTDKK